MLATCLLSPSLAGAQPGSPAPPGPAPVTPPAPRPPGAFAPFTPSRPDLGHVFGTSARSIAGPEYRLGPGDILEVQIAGRLEVNRVQVTVDPEGAVTIPPLGQVTIGGLTLLDANHRLAERARQVLRFAEVSVTVVAPRAFEVVVSGEVERPGTMQVVATQRLHEVVLTAGGITPRGSARRVAVTRDGRTDEVDLLAFELRGGLEQNPYVQEGMRIHVPPRTASVVLSGAVRRPGEYELGPSRSLREVLELTGGLTPGGAGSEARLTRVGPDGRKETSSLDLRAVLAAPADVTLQSGDALYVPPLSVLQDVVEVRGAFQGTAESSKTSITGKPTIVQRFELARGERVRDVVIKAGGAAAFADLGRAFVERSG
ncbi:MAG TPA: SLBB domain-containing protein, partial [Methylomirabilota bacterium]|nr:SLBB domain-containing protein [Methylomirabilota bacterium]